MKQNKILSSELKGIEDLQVLRENVDMYCYLGENTSNYTLDEALEIPVGKPSYKRNIKDRCKNHRQGLQNSR